MSVVHVGKENFEEVVLKSGKKVLLDFWATWCGPCQRIAPFVEEIAQEREDILVCKVDVDEATELAIAYGVTSIPTLMVFENGKKVNQRIGYCSKEDILKML